MRIEAELLRLHIVKDIDLIEQCLLDGAAENHAEYRFLVGQLRGLNQALKQIAAVETREREEN